MANMQRIAKEYYVQLDHGASTSYVIPGFRIDLDAMANACLSDAALNCHAFIK